MQTMKGSGWMWLVDFLISSLKAFFPYAALAFRPVEDVFRCLVEVADVQVPICIMQSDAWFTAINPKHQTAMRLELRSRSKLQTLILTSFCSASMEPWLDFRHHVDPERSGINEIKETSETWRKPQQIPRRRGLSLAAYQQEFEGQIPVVLEGVYEKTDCLKDGWIEKMIMEPFEDERVIFLAHKNGAERIMATKLRKFVKNVNKNYQNAWSYLRDEFFLQRHMDLIAACPPLPPFLEGQDYFSLMPAMFPPANATLLWGGRYSRSKLHVDPYNWTGTNLVLRGEKFFRLIPPGGHDRMLEVVTKNCGMALECISYESKKDLFESVPQGIPLWETKLQNGELLIIPSGWWHQAVNLGNTLAMVRVLSASDLLISNWQQMGRKGIRKMTWNHQLANLNLPFCQMQGGSKEVLKQNGISVQAYALQDFLGSSMTNF